MCESSIDDDVPAGEAMQVNARRQEDRRNRAAYMRRPSRFVGMLVLSATMLLSACGGGSDSSTPPTPVNSYAVGGTVTGLASAASLQLQNNGSDTASITANGNFTFTTKLASGASYAVSVKTQPAGQFCNVANGSGAVSSSTVTNVSVVCAKTLAGGSGALAASGGTVTTAAADVNAPAGASLTTQNVTVSSVAPPSGLPAAFTAVGAAVDVAVDNAASINAPFKITVRYDSSVVPNEGALAVVHYNTTTHKYEPVTILNQDTSTHAFTFESRVFSPFLVVAVDLAAIPASHNVTNYDVSKNGWNIPNFASYYSQNGNCLGMSAYANWYFANGTDKLNGKYSASGSPNIAQLVAARAHLAQSQYWAAKSSTYLSTLGNGATARLMRAYLAAFDQPLVLLLGVGGSARHASVLYGYDSAGFKFYDVNIVNSAETVTFDGTNWGTYSGYDSFSYVALPSLGRTEDFAQLTTEAVGGFTNSNLITVTSPTPSQQIDAHSVHLTGTLSGSLNSNASMIAYVKGVAQLVSASTGTFDATLPISAGDNTIVLFAGADISQQSNWYANAATLILDVTGTAQPTTLLTTLTWNQDNADVDLYVTEPSPSGQTAWFGNHATSNSLSLDFDNTQGFGPEHTTLTTIGNGAGTALAGDYAIWVHYFSDHGSGQTATGTVTILVDEGQPNQVLMTKSFTIATSNFGNADPGSTGPDWVKIGTVNVITGTITLDP